MNDTIGRLMLCVVIVVVGSAVASLWDWIFGTNGVWFVFGMLTYQYVERVWPDFKVWMGR